MTSTIVLSSTNLVILSQEAVRLGQVHCVLSKPVLPTPKLLLPHMPQNLLKENSLRDFPGDGSEANHSIVPLVLFLSFFEDGCKICFFQLSETIFSLHDISKMMENDLEGTHLGAAHQPPET